MPRRSLTRPGFTLTELVVVLFIVGILIAMLLPAIQTGSTSARRSACSNNLKQLVLAAHTYHDAHNQLVPIAAEGPWSASWAVQLSPYMESHRHPTLYELNGSWSLELPANQESLQGFTNSSFVCPARRRPMLASDPSLALAFTPTDYAVCNSTTECWALDDPKYRGGLANGAFLAPAIQRAGGKLPQGRLRFTDITDGLASTIFLGEKHLPRGAKLGTLGSLDGPSATIGNSPAWFNSSIRRMGKLPDPHNPECAPVGTGILTATDPQPPFATFGSWHPEICQFGMGDGRVQALRNDLDPRICAALIQRNDGEAVNLDE